MLDDEGNKIATELVRRDDPRNVKDPETAERLSSPSTPSGASASHRLGYFETFNRDNVTLVDLRKDADRGDHADRATDGEAEFDST